MSKIDNPFFAPVSGLVQSPGQTAVSDPAVRTRNWDEYHARDINSLVNATISPTDQVAGIVQELVSRVFQIQIIPNNSLRRCQFPLCKLKDSRDLIGSWY
jgi:hypothetical protein